MNNTFLNILFHVTETMEMLRYDNLDTSMFSLSHMSVPHGQSTVHFNGQIWYRFNYKNVLNSLFPQEFPTVQYTTVNTKKHSQVNNRSEIKSYNVFDVLKYIIET